MRGMENRSVIGSRMIMWAGLILMEEARGLFDVFGEGLHRDSRRVGGAVVLGSGLEEERC